MWSRECGVRRAAESPRTFSSESSTSAWLGRQMAGVLRSWQMGFRCLAEPNLQSTPPWSVHCTVTAGPDRVQPTRREWLWRQQDAAKSGDTRSWWGQEREAGWWCSELKLGADGRIPRLHQPTGQSTGTTGTAAPPTWGRTGLVHPLGVHGVLCGGTGSGGFAVGPPSGSGS